MSGSPEAQLVQAIRSCFDRGQLEKQTATILVNYLKEFKELQRRGILDKDGYLVEPCLAEVETKQVTLAFHRDPKKKELLYTSVFRLLNDKPQKCALSVLICLFPIFNAAWVSQWVWPAHEIYTRAVILFL
jgi:hypothetical protein